MTIPQYCRCTDQTGLADNLQKRFIDDEAQVVCIQTPVLAFFC